MPKRFTLLALLVFMYFPTSLFSQQINGSPNGLKPAQIPLGTGYNVGQVFSVGNGASATDCSVGGGSTAVVCLWNGSAWTAIGNGAGSTNFSLLTSGTNNTAAMVVTSPGSLSGSGVNAATATSAAGLNGTSFAGTSTHLVAFGAANIPVDSGIVDTAAGLLAACTGCAPLASPTFTGTPSLPTGATAVTQSQLNGSTAVSTTLYTDTAVANAVAGNNPAIAVLAATTAAGNTSTWTYANGASGIGATFTGPTNTAITIDGVTFTTVGQRLLIKNDTQSPSGAFNGIYALTVLHTGIAGDIYTRVLDYDAPSDMNNTGAIPVQSGTVNGSTSWLMTAQIVTVGTTPLTFVQFSYAPAVIPTLAGNNAFTGANTIATSLAPTGAGTITANAITPGTLTDCDPLNMTTVCADDEFISMGVTNQLIGQLGWTLGAVVGGSPVATIASGIWPHVGVTKVTSAAVKGDGAYIALTPLTTSFGSSGPWDSYFEFAFGVAAGALYRVGFGNGVTVVEPTTGFYLRFDESLASLATATYVSGGTVTGTSTQTCNVAFVGGTAVGTIALTGTNSIAGGTFTITGAGKGYNSITPITATLTSGTATCSGTATITSTINAAASGGDTTFHLCNNGTPANQIEICYDTGVNADTNYHKLRVHSAASGTIGLTLDAGTEQTFCASSCTFTLTPSNSVNMGPFFASVSDTTTTAETLLVDFWRFKAPGLSF